MAASTFHELKIDSEQAAWDALEGLLDGTIDGERATLDLTNLKWTQVRVKYEGKPFNQTVTASIMRGLIEYQNDVYRSAALILKEDGRVTRLTDLEKSQLELIFKVESGSSNLISSAKESLDAFGSAVGKMTGKQVLIAVLTFLILFFGTQAVGLYLDHVIKNKQIEAESKGREFDLQEKKDLFEFIDGIIKKNGADQSTIDSAFRSSLVASEIGENNRHAIDEIIRNSTGADSVVIQQTTIPSYVINEITRSTRARSEKITLKKLFKVAGVDSENTDAYTVKLDPEDGSHPIIAELEDPLVGSSYQKAISNAEWSHEPVMVHVVARKVGQRIVDAKIVKAYKPRTRKTDTA